MSFTCDLCGACCRGQLVEITQVDVVREPRLAGKLRCCTLTLVPGQEPRLDMTDPALGPPQPAPGEPAGVQRFPALAMVAGDPLTKDRGGVVRGGCAFLGDGCRCAIYPTRPGACVMLPAGSDKCQADRARQGLPPLLPDPEPPAPAPAGTGG